MPWDREVALTTQDDRLSGSPSIGPEDIEAIGLGAAVLSAGGASFPYLESLVAKELLGEGPRVEMRAATQLTDDSRVALIAMVGAPLILFERFLDPEHFTRPARLIARHLGVSFEAVMPYEIGSMNALIPLMVASRLGLPLVDADTLGRSFPETSMSAFAIAGVDMTPVAVSDIRLNDLIVEQTTNARWTETLLRTLATTFGSVIAICGTHTGREIKDHAFHGTYSRATRIGWALLNARMKHADPVTRLLEAERGSELVRGKVIDVERRTTDGFVRGSARIEAPGERSAVVVTFQNEYSLVERRGHRCAMVPDLIVVLDEERGEPIGTEALRYGQRVAVLRFPPMQRHLTARALAAVGPRSFGFDFDYEDMDQRGCP